ncbi:MAG: hypothetical protein LAO56_13255 [Acidobacteriia bacterium]|nr:hypothetical protein [Terriglobia bacterium]
MLLNVLADTDPNGIWNFDNLEGFLTNQPTKFQGGIASTLSPRNLRQALFGAYLQDDWRARPNLTRAGVPLLLWKRLAGGDDEEVPLHEKSPKRHFQRITGSGTLAMGLLGPIALPSDPSALGRAGDLQRGRVRHPPETS